VDQMQSMAMWSRSVPIYKYWGLNFFEGAHFCPAAQQPGVCASESAEPWDWLQGVEGVPNIEQGLNPATWMLEVTTPGMEDKLGVSFAEYYSQSELAK